MNPHVVIVGGGFGGLRAARALAKAPVSVTLVDRRLSARTAARIEESEARLRAMVETAPDAVVIVNEAYEIAQMNGTAERLFGWRREEVIGRDIDVLVPERFRGMIHQIDIPKLGTDRKSVV